MAAKDDLENLFRENACAFCRACTIEEVDDETVEYLCDLTGDTCEPSKHCPWTSIFLSLSPNEARAAMNPEVPYSPTNPSHYRSGSVECIDAIQASMLPVEFIGYLKGNVMKYIWRAEDKHPEKPGEDLMKARWYLNRWISAVAPQDAE